MTTEEFDVLICGSGSAGICAAIWLARYGVRFQMLEARDGPLRVGQADGVQCRTVEIFESLGIADALLNESYHVMEITFWSASNNTEGGIQRDYVGPDTEPGLSHQPHVILNQARVNEIMVDEASRLSGGHSIVEYGRKVKDVVVIKEAEADVSTDLRLPYVKLTAENKDGQSREYRAQYVLVSKPSAIPIKLNLSWLMHRRPAMARTAPFANLSASTCRVKAPTPTGASWTSLCTRTSPTSAKRPSSSLHTAALS